MIIWIYKLLSWSIAVWFGIIAEDTNLKRFCDDKDMGNGLEHAIIVYSKTSIQKPAHEKDPALRKYYKRVKGMCA